MERQDAELKAALVKMTWPVEYGSVKISIQKGRPVMVTIERTVKMD